MIVLQTITVRQSGTLIVGDPDVGRVRYKGMKKCFFRLPCARNEAAMIGQLLARNKAGGSCNATFSESDFCSPW